MSTKIQKMKYIENKQSFLYLMLALILVVISTLTLTTSWAPFGVSGEGMRVAFEIMISLVMMMVIFLMAEKVKKYDYKWSIGTIIFGGLHMLRAFLLPLTLFSLNNEEVMLMSKTTLTFVMIEIIVASILIIGAGVVGVIKCRKIQSIQKGA